MARPRSTINGQITTGEAEGSDERLEQLSAYLPEGMWQCQVCRSVRISQRAVFSVSRGGTIQRMICEACGAVGHYDTPSGEGLTPMMTHNRKFLVVGSSIGGTPDTPRTTATPISPS